MLECVCVCVDGIGGGGGYFRKELMCVCVKVWWILFV